MRRYRRYKRKKWTNWKTFDYGLGWKRSVYKSRTGKKWYKTDYTDGRYDSEWYMNPSKWYDTHDAFGKPRGYNMSNIMKFKG